MIHKPLNIILIPGLIIGTILAIGIPMFNRASTKATTVALTKQVNDLQIALDNCTELLAATRTALTNERYVYYETENLRRQNARKRFKVVTRAFVELAYNTGRSNNVSMEAMMSQYDGSIDDITAEVIP